MFSLENLQIYWWLLVSILGALFVFMTFIQGGQTLLFQLSNNEDQKTALVNALGRKWEVGFSTLVIFGGALFAAFPLFYAVSFGGAYFLWMGILFCFIILAVSYEYRTKPDNFLGQKVYEGFLFINGFLGVFLIGIAVASLYTGGSFIINDMNLSTWTNSAYGLEAIFNIFNLAFAFMLVFLARITGSMFFMYSLDDKEIEINAKKALKIDSPIFLVMFLFVVGYLLTTSGYMYNANNEIYKVDYKFLNILLDNPIDILFILIGVVLLLWSIYNAIFGKNTRINFWVAGLGIVITVTMLLLILGIHNSSFYPSLSDMQSSLTIGKSSGSLYTLKIMSVVSLLVPVVLGYVYYVWKSMDKHKLTVEEIKNDPHSY